MPYGIPEKIISMIKLLSTTCTSLYENFTGQVTIGGTVPAISLDFIIVIDWVSKRAKIQKTSR